MELNDCLVYVSVGVIILGVERRKINHWTIPLLLDWTFYCLPFRRLLLIYIFSSMRCCVVDKQSVRTRIQPQ